jgi:pyruvate/2-oxoglutarate dehydrogenase complex dihydrolipoamide dehydrogenase (E3) component
MDSFDVAIIGTGQAGVPLATRLVEAGKRVLIAERAELGGTCVNTGCTPTKTLIATARAAHVARSAGKLGVRVSEVSVDFPAAIRRKDEIVQRWRDGVEKRLGGHGDRLRLLRGHARFVGARELEVDGKRFRADVVVINVGARPVVPDVPGLAGVQFLDNGSVMALSALPRHLLVLGGGYIGCELGQLFRRFGAEVTLIEGGPHVLGREAPEISSVLEEVFQTEGVHVRCGAKVREVAPGPHGVRLTLEGGGVLEGSLLLVAVGRRPNTDDLGCEAAGIRLDSRGFVEVDDRYRTSVPGVFALGDATAQPQFTHTSWDDHRLLFDVLMGREGRGRSERIIPYTVFTDPQIAGVGLDAAEARRRGIPHEVATLPFGSVARAIEVDETAGWMQVVIDPATERILGARIAGAQAGELIHTFVALMAAKAPARAIVDAEFVHPTFAEGVQSLVMRLPRYALG